VRYGLVSWCAVHLAEGLAADDADSTRTSRLTCSAKAVYTEAVQHLTAERRLAMAYNPGGQPPYNQQYPYPPAGPPPPPPPPKRGMGTGAKVALFGCLGLLLLGIFCAIVGGVVWMVMNKNTNTTNVNNSNTSASNTSSSNKSSSNTNSSRNANTSSS